MNREIYAGFWVRVLASIIDSAVTWGLFWATLTLNSSLANYVFNESIVQIVIGTFIAFAITPTYWVFMEVKYGTTLGKMALGLIVINYQGEKISIGKSIGRYFGKFVSYFILCVGFIMVAGTEKKQGLHDIMSGCLVVKKYRFVSTATFTERQPNM